MPRKIVPIVPTDPYHICARCHNREWFELPLETVWSIMEDYLYLMAHAYELRIHAFVLMANHFHLLATAPSGNLSEILLYFMRETSKEISRLTGRVNQTYGTRNHKTRIPSHIHYLTAYKYVYRNPVRAGQVRRFAEEYPYSTLHGLCGLSRLIIPVHDEGVLYKPEFDESAINWINDTPSAENDELVRLALRRAEFTYKAERATRKRSELETRPL